MVYIPESLPFCCLTRDHAYENDRLSFRQILITDMPSARVAKDIRLSTLIWCKYHKLIIYATAEQIRLISIITNTGCDVVYIAPLTVCDESLTELAVRIYSQKSIKEIIDQEFAHRRNTDEYRSLRHFGNYAPSSGI